MENNILKKAKELTGGAEIVVLMKFGSHLYGTNTENSDVDYKGIYIPNTEDILMGKEPKMSISFSTGSDNGKNTNEDIDLEMITLRGFLELCRRGEIMALDMLFAPDEMILEQEKGTWSDIIKNRSKLLHKGTSAFIGYCRNQVAKYGIKGSRLDSVSSMLEFLETKDSKSKLVEHLKELEDLCKNHEEFFSIQVLEKEQRNIGGGVIKDEFANHYLAFTNKKYMLNSKVKDVSNALIKYKEAYGDRAEQAKENKGVDFKAVSHALRACYQAIELFRSFKITMPLTRAEEIKNVKIGNVDYLEVAEKLENLMFEVEKSKEVSMLPESIDKEFWDKYYCFKIINKIKSE